MIRIVSRVGVCLHPPYPRCGSSSVAAFGEIALDCDVLDEGAFEPEALKEIRRCVPAAESSRLVCVYVVALHLNRGPSLVVSSVLGV